MNYTIEDYIEILSGIVEPDNIFGSFNVDDSDKGLIFSLAKQTIKGIPYTDRQYELAKSKVIYYKEQFIQYDIELALNTLRMPLREIDRSKWIKADDKYICIRFPFTKKMIKYIDFLETISDRKKYDKQNKIHFVPFNELNIYEVVGQFKDANFNIDDTLTNIYEAVKIMKNKKEEYAPGIFSLKLKNLHNKAIDYALSSIGEPNIENLVRYKDKQDTLGIVHFDEDDLSNSVNATQPLTRRIIYRTQRHVFIDAKEFTMDNLAESMLELYRFPILFLLPENERSLDLMHKVQSSFKNIIPNESVTNLYRKENSTDGNKEYNNYIKENNLNNSLAIDTKIVYTSNNKIPKPLLETKWQPSVAIQLESKRANTQVDSYLNGVDLVIHYDDKALLWKGYVEKI